MEISGQITVATSGTAVRGPSIDGQTFLIKAHPDNTGVLWVGNVNGDVSSLNGFPLEAGDPPLFVETAGLEHIWFDASADNQVACWFLVQI